MRGGKREKQIRRTRSWSSLPAGCPALVSPYPTLLATSRPFPPAILHRTPHHATPHKSKTVVSVSINSVTANKTGRKSESGRKGKGRSPEELKTHLPLPPALHARLLLQLRLLPLQLLLLIVQLRERSCSRLLVSQEDLERLTFVDGEDGGLGFAMSY